jgi:hypothetical protein
MSRETFCHTVRFSVLVAAIAATVLIPLASLI